MNNTLIILFGTMKRNKAKTWKSELDYLVKESKFLHHIFEEYYLSFSSEYYIKQLTSFDSTLCKLDRDIKEITMALEVRLSEYDRLNGDDKNNSHFQTNLIKIEKSINQIQLKFRALKEKLFQFIESTEDINEAFSHS